MLLKVTLIQIKGKESQRSCVSVVPAGNTLLLKIVLKLAWKEGEGVI